MQLPNRKSPRLKEFDYSNVNAYFITICTADKQAFFADNDGLNRNIIECLLNEKRRAGFLVYVYCLMPDHFHLLLCPPGGELSVSGFIGGLKSKTTRIAWSHGQDGKLWQSRFHDHIVRKREGLEKIGLYILDNPVRKGLVDNWEKYKYCGVVDSWI